MRQEDSVSVKQDLGRYSYRYGRGLDLRLSLGHRGGSPLRFDMHDACHGGDHSRDRGKMPLDRHGLVRFASPFLYSTVAGGILLGGRPRRNIGHSY